MIKLLFENEVSNCFITLFSLACTASIFSPIISILIPSAKRTNVASWVFKVNHLYITKIRGALELMPEDPVFYFLMQGFIYLLVFYHSQ